MTTTTSSSGSRIIIPDKLYFRIGDVAELVGVKPYVLRYWESEFPMINPQKSASGQRVYRRNDVEVVVMIKHLLYEERYSIEGARKRIRELRKEGELRGLNPASSAVPSSGKEIPQLALTANSPVDLNLDNGVIPHGIESTDLLPEILEKSKIAETSELLAPSAHMPDANSIRDPQLIQQIREGLNELKKMADAPISDLFRY